MAWVPLDAGRRRARGHLRRGPVEHRRRGPDRHGRHRRPRASLATSRRRRSSCSRYAARRRRSADRLGAPGRGPQDDGAGSTRSSAGWASTSSPPGSRVYLVIGPWKRRGHRLDERHRILRPAAKPAAAWPRGEPTVAAGRDPRHRGPRRLVWLLMRGHPLRPAPQGGGPEPVERVACMGIPTDRYLLGAFAICGALAGLAGTIQVDGRPAQARAVGLRRLRLPGDPGRAAGRLPRRVGGADRLSSSPSSRSAARQLTLLLEPEFGDRRRAPGVLVLFVILRGRVAACAVRQAPARRRRAHAPAPGDAAGMPRPSSVRGGASHGRDPRVDHLLRQRRWSSRRSARRSARRRASSTCPWRAASCSPRWPRSSVAFESGNVIVGFLAAVAVGADRSPSIVAFASIKLRLNQIAVGFVLAAAGGRAELVPRRT